MRSQPSRHAPVEPGEIPHERVKLSNMRKTIARRLAESKQTVPHFYLTVDVRLDPLLVATFAGSGVIGLEIGQALGRLGVRVVVLGRGGRLGPITDPFVQRSALKTFGAEFELDPDAHVSREARAGDEVEIEYLGPDGGKRVERFEYVLAATGRTPNVDRLALVSDQGRAGRRPGRLRAVHCAGSLGDDGSVRDLPEFGRTRSRRVSLSSAAARLQDDAGSGKTFRRSTMYRS